MKKFRNQSNNSGRSSSNTTEAVKMSGRQSRSFSLVCLLIVSLNLLLLSGSSSKFSTAEARYLPTRADETEVEILKEIIRNLIAKTRAEQLDNQVNRLGYSTYPYENVRQRRAELFADSFSGSNGNESPQRTIQSSGVGSHPLQHQPLIANSDR